MRQSLILLLLEFSLWGGYACGVMALISIVYGFFRYFNPAKSWSNILTAFVGGPLAITLLKLQGEEKVAFLRWIRIGVFFLALAVIFWMFWGLLFYSLRY